MSVKTILGPSDSIVAGSDLVFRVLVTEDGRWNGTPTNMTGKATTFVLRKSKDDGSAGDVLTSKTFAAGTITYANVNGTADAVDAEIDATDLDDTWNGTAHWAVWRTDSGNTRCLAWGTVVIERAAAVPA